MEIVLKNKNEANELFLNMALMYIKLEKLENARRSWDEALGLDRTSLGALYQ